MFLFLKLNTKDCAPKFPAYVDAQKNRFTRTYCVFFFTLLLMLLFNQTIYSFRWFQQTKICKEFPKTMAEQDL